MTQTTCDNGTWYAKPDKPFEPNCCEVFEDSFYNSPLTDTNGVQMYIMCNDWLEEGYCDRLDNDIPNICPGQGVHTFFDVIFQFTLHSQKLTFSCLELQL